MEPFLDRLDRLYREALRAGGGSLLPSEAAQKVAAAEGVDVDFVLYNFLDKCQCQTGA